MAISSEDRAIPVTTDRNLVNSVPEILGQRFLSYVILVADMNIMHDVSRFRYPVFSSYEVANFS